MYSTSKQPLMYQILSPKFNYRSNYYPSTILKYGFNSQEYFKRQVKYSIKLSETVAIMINYLLIFKEYVNSGTLILKTLLQIKKNSR